MIKLGGLDPSDRSQYATPKYLDLPKPLVSMKWLPTHPFFLDLYQHKERKLNKREAILLSNTLESSKTYMYS